MQVWDVLHAARWKCRTQKIAKNSPFGHHLTTLSGYIFAIKARIDNWKKPVKQQYLLHMSPQYDKLWSTNGWDLLASLGHSSKFQRVSHLGFVTAATSLNRGQANFARCLPISWTGTLYIHWERNFATCKIHFASKSGVLLYWHRYCTAFEQWASVKFCSVVQGMELWNFCRGRHLYLARQPSRWASAHILVLFLYLFQMRIFRHYRSRFYTPDVLPVTQPSQILFIFTMVICSITKWSAWSLHCPR